MKGITKQEFTAMLDKLIFMAADRAANGTALEAYSGNPSTMMDDVDQYVRTERDSIIRGIYGGTFEEYN